MDILYYSNFCKHSQKVLQTLAKTSVVDKISFICIKLIKILKTFLFDYFLKTLNKGAHFFIILNLSYFLKINILIMYWT